MSFIKLTNNVIEAAAQSIWNQPTTVLTIRLRHRIGWEVIQPKGPYRADTSHTMDISPKHPLKWSNVSLFSNYAIRENTWYLQCILLNLKGCIFEEQVARSEYAQECGNLKVKDGTEREKRQSVAVRSYTELHIVLGHKIHAQPPGFNKGVLFKVR